MTSYAPPKRRLSSNTTLNVASASLPWVPSPGKFNTVFRADTGNTFHTLAEIDPNLFNADGTARTLYQRLWSSPNNGSGSGLVGLLEAEGGGTYNPLVGTKGSIFLFNGGHNSIDQSNAFAFDLALGKWTNFTYPIYAAVEKTINPQGSLATLSGSIVNRGLGTVPSAGWDKAIDNTSPYDEGSGISPLNRVDARGNYRMYADGTAIPGAGDEFGAGATVFNPYPPHTYCGIIYLPPEGGGGSMGSILFNSHSQTGISTREQYYVIYKLDCATRVWSQHAYGYGSLLPLFTIKSGGLEYDPDKRLVWYFAGTGVPPIAFDFNQNPVKWNKLSGASFSPSQNAPNACYMPGRNFMVYVRTTSTASPNLSYRVPTLAGFSTAGFAFNSGVVQNSFSFVERALTVNPPGGSVYAAHLAAGTDTGWPGWKSENVFNPDTGLPVWGASANSINGAVDYGDIMYSPYGRPADNDRAPNDRLEYCAAEDCLIYLERQLGTANGRARSTQTRINLWKLRPPPVGQEITGTWTWEKEVILQHNTSTTGGAAFKFATTNQPSWGGKAKYIPSLKCVTYIDDTVLPVQAVRSSAWT